MQKKVWSRGPGRTPGTKGPRSRGPGRTGPRDLEGPVVLAGQDLETLKVPGLFLKWSRDLPTPFFPSHCILSLACKNQ